MESTHYQTRHQNRCNVTGGEEGSTTEGGLADGWGGAQDMEAEGSGAEEAMKTIEERYMQLEAQMVQMWDENMRLQEELKKKGKQPEQG